MKEALYKPLHVNRYNILFHWERILQVLRSHEVYLTGSATPPIPITVEVGPVDFCNHGCVWCSARNHRETDRMGLDVLRSFLQQIKAGGVRSIHFAGGGEATLYKGLFPQLDSSESLVCELAAVGEAITLGLITNGSVFDLLDLDRIVEMFSWIRFSVDAASEARYQSMHRPRGHDLQHVLRNIRALIQARANRIYPIVGSSFIFEHNDASVYREVLEFAEIMTDARVDYVQIKPENNNRGEETKSFLKRLPNDLERILHGYNTFVALHTPYDQSSNSEYCWYSYFGPVVGATGDVYVCCCTYNQDAFRYGQIGEKRSFDDVWGSQRRHELVAGIDPTQCPSCRHNTFNLLVEHFAHLPVSLQDDLTQVLNSVKTGVSFEEVTISGELSWLEPGFRHVERVVRTGYNRILDFPVFRETKFVGYRGI